MKDIPQTCDECPFMSQFGEKYLCDLAPSNEIVPELIAKKRSDRCIFNYTAISAAVKINISPMTLWERADSERPKHIDWRTKGRD